MSTSRFPSFILSILALSITLFFIGCGGGGGGGNDSESMYPTPDISGVWVGAINEANDDLSIGIIIKENDEYVSRFIAGNRQYVSPISVLDVDPFVVPSNTSIFSGDLASFSWTESKGDYETVTKILSLSGSAYEKEGLGTGPTAHGAFKYSDDSDTGTFSFYYSSSCDSVPNVQNLLGEWRIQNASRNGNTLILNIIPDQATPSNMSGVISGSDDLGNVFEGNIEIHDSAEQQNIYDVNLIMNNTIELNGLATLVDEMITPIGYEINEKTLMIGTTDKYNTYSIGGLGTRQ